MKNKKETIESKIISLVKKMEHNTFLLPDSWSSEIQMSNFDWKYKTYVGTRGNSRYIVFEVIFPKGKYSFLIRGEIVEITKPISIKVSDKKLFEYIQEIYNEVHSFENHSKGVRNIRLKISENLKKIEGLREDTEKLRVRLIDAKQENNEKK